MFIDSLCRGIVQSKDRHEISKGITINREQASVMRRQELFIPRGRSITIDGNLPGSAHGDFCAEDMNAIIQTRDLERAARTGGVRWR
jgi:hypothetical protein